MGIHFGQPWVVIAIAVPAGPTVVIEIDAPSLPLRTIRFVLAPTA